MSTLVVGTPPPGLEALVERRQRAGADRLDEVWDGVYHMGPAPSGAHGHIAHQLAVLLDAPTRTAGLVAVMHGVNIGESARDFRVPARGLHRGRPRGVWHAPAALLVDIVSPGDEIWEKLGFYAAHTVDEVLILAPAERRIAWLALRDGEYQAVERSGLVDLGPAGLAELIDWP